LEIKTGQTDDISFTGLFLHDTQMALLFLAQRRLAAAFSCLAPENGIPFSCMLPFCPVGANPAKNEKGIRSPARTRITVGLAATDSGWIVAPVTGPLGESDGANGSETGGAGLFPTIPGYPALPRLSAFILGYAGPLADAVLAEAIAAERRAGEPRETTVLTSALSVRARYRASVRLSVIWDERSYSATYAIGPASWER
jgi:hypothetical protein